MFEFLMQHQLWSLLLALAGTACLLRFAVVHYHTAVFLTPSV
jgi:hypothetical protein